MRSYGITNAAPYASAPAVGAAGDTYYNSATKTLYLSDGTTWNAVNSGVSTAQQVGSTALANRTNVANTWSDWGTVVAIPTSSLPSGATANVFLQVTGFANDFTSSGTAPVSVRLAISFDNGSTWTYGDQHDSMPMGQVSPNFPNRVGLNASDFFFGTVSTQCQVKAQVYSTAATGNVTLNVGQLTWTLTSGVVGPPGPAGDLSSVSQGIVAVGTTLSLGTFPSGSWQICTSTINFTPATGRRYRIVRSVRAIAGPGSITWQLYNGASRDTTATPNEWYSSGERLYGGAYNEWYVNGDGVARVWAVYANTGTAGQQLYDGGFYVEDMGPVSPGAIAPLPLSLPWTKFTGRMTCGGGAASINEECYYAKIGRLVVARYAIEAVGYPPGQFDIELPFPHKDYGPTIFDRPWAEPIGLATLVQVNTNVSYQGFCYRDTPTQFWIGQVNTGGPIVSWKTAGPPVAATVGDEMYCQIQYEATS